MVITMNFYRGRPLALSLSAALLCAFLAGILSDNGRILFPIILLASGIVAAILLRRRPDRKIGLLPASSVLLLITAAAFLMSLSSLLFYNGNTARFRRLADGGSAAEIEGTVIGIRWASTYETCCEIRLTSLNGEKESLRGYLLCEDQAGFEIGDRIRGTVSFTAFEDVLTEEKRALAKGLVFTAHTAEKLTLIGESDTPEVFMAHLRQRMAAGFYAFLDRDAAGLAGALLLREGELDGKLYRDFVQTGASHLLVLSGTHLTVLAGLADRVLNPNRIPRRIRLIPICLLLFFYLMLTGFSFTAMRAGIMFLIAAGGFYLERDYDPITALFTAWALIVLLCPAAIFDIGLTMSAVATLGIHLVSPDADRVIEALFAKKHRHLKVLGANRANRRLWKIRRILSAAMIAIGATVALIPIQAAVFGEISRLSVPATLLLSPLFTVLLGLTALFQISILFSFLWSPLALPARLLALPITLISRLIGALASQMADDTPLISANYPFAPVLIAAGLLIIAVMIARNVSSWLWTAIPVTLLTAAFFVCVGITNAVSADERSLFYVSAGTNECIAVTSPTRAMLIDLSSGAVLASRSMSDVLSDHRITEIDTCMLTHLHRRHAILLDKLQSRRVIHRILLPEPATEAEANIAADIADVASAYGASLSFYRPGGTQTLVFEDVTVRSAAPVYLDRSTHPLLAMRFTFADPDGGEPYTAALIGGSYAEGGDLSIAEGADDLILALHGPQTPSADLTIRLENPPLRIWSASEERLTGSKIPADAVRESSFRLRWQP